MEPAVQLTQILPALSALVDRIQPAQLASPTPCDKFTVQDILDHMITGGGAFAHRFRGEEPPEITAPNDPGRVPAPEFQATMDSLLAAIQSPGALERTISAPIGSMPGDVFARLVAFDGLVHGWDLATSTGQAYEPAPDVVAAVDDFVRAALTPDMRDGDTFKDATTPPAGASRLERLVAFSGRSL